MIGGRVYRLRTDFRAGAAFQIAAAAGQTLSTGDVFRWFFGDPGREPAVRWPEDAEAALEGIGRFLRREDRPVGKQTDAGRRPPAYELLTDADILTADFLREYGIDLTTAELHWWRFMALLEGLYCYRFADRVGFRVTDPGRIPAKQRKEFLKKRKLFAIRQGSAGETYAEHIARLDALIAERQAKGSD